MAQAFQVHRRFHCDDHRSCRTDTHLNVQRIFPGTVRLTTSVPHRSHTQTCLHQRYRIIIVWFSALSMHSRVILMSQKSLKSPRTFTNSESLRLRRVYPLFTCGFEDSYTLTYLLFFKDSCFFVSLDVYTYNFPQRNEEAFLFFPNPGDLEEASTTPGSFRQASDLALSACQSAGAAASASASANSGGWRRQLAPLLNAQLGGAWIRQLQQLAAARRVRGFRTRLGRCWEVGPGTGLGGVWGNCSKPSWELLAWMVLRPVVPFVWRCWCLLFGVGVVCNISQFIDASNARVLCGCVVTCMRPTYSVDVCLFACVRFTWQCFLH